MLKIDRDNQSFSLLDTPSLADVSITERYDLQEFICNTPDAFFKEIGQELFLLGKEIEPSKNMQDRIDVLAVDKEGACVVVELKRGNHKLHMMQAISYAGMIAQWSSDDFLQLLDDGKQDALIDFLEEVDVEKINRSQRIILVAEAFDYALLIGAEWLSDNYGVDVMCCRIAVAKDAATNNEYLVCSNVYPAPELAQEAVPRGRRKSATNKAKWSDWDSALAKIKNSAVADYYREQLEAKRESYLRKRILHYRIDGKRRWFAAARQARSYVWQHGRFDGDIEFWQHGLSDAKAVKPVKDGKCLSFFLATKDDFDFFHQAATEKLLASEWLAGSPEEELDEVEAEE
ncbi:MAG: hypothetical protein GKR94_29895 [Gammaproteobacteria bacterium]|nr:hypothetical protein [Gammaproteobacteria bacterium]